MSEPTMIVVPRDAGEIALRRGMADPIETNRNGSHASEDSWAPIDLAEHQVPVIVGVEDRVAVDARREHQRRGSEGDDEADQFQRHHDTACRSGVVTVLP